MATIEHRLTVRDAIPDTALIARKNAARLGRAAFFLVRPA
jgi:hypothetical protein